MSSHQQGKQFQTKRGVLLECDIPIKQFILYLNDKDIKEQRPSFLVEDLDDTHVIIGVEFLSRIKQEVSNFVESNAIIAAESDNKRSASSKRTSL